MYSVMMFGPSAWTDVGTQDLDEFKQCSPVAARHAEKLNDRLLAICRLKVPEGITKGKFFLERNVIKYVCNFYEQSEYTKRAAFESNHPLFHKYFGQLLPRVELARGELTWRGRSLRDVPDFELVTPLFEGDEYREKKLLLSPLRSQVEQSTFAELY